MCLLLSAFTTASPAAATTKTSNHFFSHFFFVFWISFTIQFIQVGKCFFFSLRSCISVWISSFFVILLRCVCRCMGIDRSAWMAPIDRSTSYMQECIWRTEREGEREPAKCVWDTARRTPTTASNTSLYNNNILLCFRT